jgi:polyferredoxin
VGFDKHFTTGKLLLFGGSAFVSLILGMSVGAAASSFVVGLITVVAAFPAYVYGGAHATRAAEDLMRWGFPEEETWTTEQRLMYGAGWPVVLLFWLVVSAFNRLVTDLYK